MRRAIMAVTVSLCLFSVSKAADRVQYKDIQQHVAQALKNDVIEFMGPIIEIDETRKMVSFGDVSVLTKLDVGDPCLNAALRQQVRIDAFRQRRNTKSAKRFWKKPLAKCEDRIAKTVQKSDSLNSDEALKESIKLRDDVDRIITSTLQDYAKSIGYKYGQMRYAPAFAKVSFVVIPSGATVSHMPAGQWQLYDFMVRQRKRKNVPRPRWNAISKRKDVRMLGTYYFKVSHGGSAFVTPDPMPLVGKVVLRCTLSSVTPLE